jgi:hypothetical protein
MILVLQVSRISAEIDILLFTDREPAPGRPAQGIDFAESRATAASGTVLATSKSSEYSFRQSL